MLTPEQRTLRSRVAAHSLHSQVDSRAHTEPARRAFLAQFEDKVDPDHVLPEDERRRRAEQLRKAHFSAMALKSSRARKSAKARRRAS